MNQIGSLKTQSYFFVSNCLHRAKVEHEFITSDCGKCKLDMLDQGSPTFLVWQPGAGGGGTFMHVSTHPYKWDRACMNSAMIAHVTQTGPQAPMRCSGNASPMQCRNASASGVVALAETIAPA